MFVADFFKVENIIVKSNIILKLNLSHNLIQILISRENITHKIFQEARILI